MVSASDQTNTTARSRAVIAAFGCAALAFGALAALDSTQWLTAAVVLLFIFVAAMTLPLTWVALIVAAVVPFQFYFEIPDSLFSLRGAVVFVFAAALRLLIQRIIRKDVARWQTWALAAALFLLAAVAAAFGAQSRYLAFRGIYDWLVIFATAFVVAEIARTRQAVERLAIVLVAAGVAQAVIGLVEYAFGLETVLGILRLPVSELFFQPNLLRERLTDVSFNWIVFERASPFGTFINGIDYAIFLAAILGLALAILFAGRDKEVSLRATVRSETIPLPKREIASSLSLLATLAPHASAGVTRTVAIFACVLLLGGALLLTFKGSGMIAFAGAAATIALLYAPRPSPRVLAIGLICLIVALLLTLPFADQIAQRASFLVQREQGATGTAGRFEIWVLLLQQFAQRPVFGYGLNHAATLTEATRTLRSGAVALNNPAAESGYVAALVETGIIGFAALMALFAATLARAVRSARTDAMFSGILAALVALLLGNLTVAGFTTDQNGMLLGALIGMTFGLNPRITRIDAQRNS